MASLEHGENNKSLMKSSKRTAKVQVLEQDLTIEKSHVFYGT
ncbi:protein of unknown function [Shewanella benthica]|uniref:Uncharacterized protein n=1 Tax=Shewanella benthica TaxID=43661 RepID=A0A330M551_9GAMM|nr:protein of unknown function [Shewanella benthica]